MTDRVRDPRDVRIVPGATPPCPSAPRASSNATAVQIFRLLASQPGAGPLTALAAETGEHPVDPSDDNAPALDAVGTACDSAMPAQARAETQEQGGEAPLHAEPQHDASAHASTVGSRSLSRREAKSSETPPAAEQDTALGKQIVHACAVAAHGELFTRELADRIARFCSTSGASGDASWAVTLPMNPAVLPDTLLHLQLSPSSIGIRFETPNPRSTQLISDNADALRTRLADALGRQIDVDIGA